METISIQWLSVQGFLVQKRNIQFVLRAVSIADSATLIIQLD